MSKRTDIVTNLKDLLTEIPDFNTIIVTNNLDDKYPYDITHENTPALKILMNEEGINYHPGHRAKNITYIDLYLYSINWDKEDLTVDENLVKLVRDKLGSDISIKGVVGNTDISSMIKLEVDYPLIIYKFNLEISYVCSTKDV